MARDIVTLLEELHGRLAEMDIGTDLAQGKPEQHGSSTDAARKRLNALKAMSQAGRTDGNALKAYRGYPSISSRH